MVFNVILHQFNRPGALDRHRKYLKAGDAILLIEDAVFDHALLEGSDGRDVCSGD